MASSLAGDAQRPFLVMEIHAKCIWRKSAATPDPDGIRDMWNRRGFTIMAHGSIPRDPDLRKASGPAWIVLCVYPIAMKLYTKTGDDGSTGLFGTERVQKDDPRIVAFGSVDELNACVGLAAAAKCEKHCDFESTLKKMLCNLQSQLFTLGADLATVPGSEHEDKVTRIGESDIAQLENWIDEIDAGNEPMKNFVLPGGTELAARLHLARTVCRRAERDVISLSKNQSVSEHVKIYLNRLSDLLFALARRANKEAGVDDIPWISNK